MASALSESRSRARRLENELDGKLLQLGRIDAGGAGGASHLYQEVEDVLQKLGEVNDMMSREAADTGPGSTATTMHMLKRHREILHDFQQDFNKSKAALKATSERNELLSSVRKDIRDHRSAASSATGALVRERNAIHAAERNADEVMEQAAATREALMTQRSSAHSPTIQHAPTHLLESSLAQIGLHALTTRPSLKHIAQEQFDELLRRSSALQHTPGGAPSCR